MPRITPLEGRKAPFVLRLLHLASRRLYGQEMLPAKILAHSPRLLPAYAATSVFAQGKTRLDPGLRLLALHLVAEINGCSWCLDFGRAQAARYHIDPAKLEAAGDYASSTMINAAERAALAYAAEVTQVGARVTDHTFAALRAHFSEREIVELTVAVAVENFYNRLNAPLEVEAQGFCALPAQPAPRRTA
jgi:AhpD family alkylhydroperoxidase